MRCSLANEEPISRGNKGENALIRAPGGDKVLTGTGLIQTNSAGSFEKRFGLGQGKGKRGAGTLGFEATARKALRPFLVRLLTSVVESTVSSSRLSTASVMMLS